jgi:glycosyltransferase involved in cell wall biosynthesis
VCVINRNRDDYQVPRALYEAGLLETLVTDFYAPDRLARLLPPILRRRRSAAIPRAKVSPVWLSFALQAGAQALRANTRELMAFCNRAHARKGARLAARRRAHLYCYANYMPEAAQMPHDARVIDFEFHPHAAGTWDLLAADFRRYPEVAASFAHEEAELARDRINTAWQRADAVVCASSMTRRSLETVGCPPERISVIPYGFAPPDSLPTARPAGPCRFLFVGQGVQRKGLHHLIRAWQADTPPNATLTLVCYRIDPGIAALIESPSIELLGYQERPALERQFATADVFVMPSLVEGFGLVYLEALAAGCHVVGTSNTGLVDLPLSSAAASVLEPGDIAGLTAALHALARRKAAGALDAPAIAAEAGKRPWSAFRREIAEHARAIVAGG